MEYAPSHSSRLSPAWVVGLLALGIIAFGNGIYGQFIFDDENNIVENAAIRSMPPLTAILNPRGLGTLSFVFNYAVGGVDERGYHLVNIAIHLAAACTLLGVARRTLLLPESAAVFREHATFLAFAIAAIWMVHPLQTQSVTYIVQRLEALMGLFFLLTLYCTLRGATAERAGWVWYVGAVASFGLSLLSKEVAIVAPVVVLLYDRMFLAKSWAEVVNRRWGLYLAFVPGMFWLLSMLSGSLAPALDADATATDSAVGFGLSFMTPWNYLRSQPAVLLHYVRLSFWPSQLCLDYLWQIESNPWRIYGFGLIIVVLVLGSIGLYFRRQPVGFLGLAFFLVLAPTSSFVPIADLAFEHRMYLALAPLVTLVVLGGYLLTMKLLSTP
ncbi:MAG TPA: hypothetical protein VL096_01225, partial [Pirellulaceae bacterium]|nr:hypothetical protein [Pirellulaceae bacterium]